MIPAAFSILEMLLIEDQKRHDLPDCTTETQASPIFLRPFQAERNAVIYLKVATFEQEPHCAAKVLGSKSRALQFCGLR